MVEVSEDMDLKISHELGFLKEIQGRRVSNQVLQFSGVTAGVWKIVKNKEQGLITRVEIANTDCDSLLK